MSKIHYRPVRALLSYLLLTLAALQGGATLLLPLAQVSLARCRASERLGQANAEEAVYILSKTDFDRNRSGTREWWHAGRLYDLKNLHFQGDSVRFTALPDAQEQWLLTGFQRLFAPDSATKTGANPLAHLLVQLLSLVFLPVDSNWVLFPPASQLAQHHFCVLSGQLPGFTHIFSPPPDGLTA